MAGLRLPGWVTIWLLVTSFICLWDATFIILRPDTLPGGKHNWFWKPYNKYIEVDKRYGDMKDAFVVIQSLMNYVEIFLNFEALFLSAIGSSHGNVVAFTSSLMTWWKTVLYAMFYLPQFATPEHALPKDPVEAILFFWLPTSIWLTLPLLVVFKLWGRLVPRVDGSSLPGAKKKTK